MQKRKSFLGKRISNCCLLIQVDSTIKLDLGRGFRLHTSLALHNITLPNSFYKENLYSDTIVRRGSELSTSFASVFLSATILDIPNILLMVFLKHDLCSSIEACINSSIWSFTSSKNVALSDFFFRQDDAAAGDVCSSGLFSVDMFCLCCK